MNDLDQRRVVASSANDRNRHLAASQSTTLADLLERVLDKGIVIAGDITLSIARVELLNIKVRLLVASIDKAEEIGIDWWRADPALSSRARAEQLEQDNQRLKERMERLEDRLLGPGSSEPTATASDDERPKDNDTPDATPAAEKPEKRKRQQIQH